jgi:P4 family phage/plasmid primase-like protien
MTVVIYLQKFEHFLDDFRIINSDARSTVKPTHTCMANIFRKKGSFNIPPEKMADFFMYYDKIVFEFGHPLSIVERPNVELGYGMLKFDLDFKYESDNLERAYNEEPILLISQILQRYLLEYVDAEAIDSKRDLLHMYIFQRPSPYKKDKDVKDGIHIMYPNLYVNFNFQYFLRQKLIDELLKARLNTMIPYKNSIYDVVDESIIMANGWLMHGCSKENIPPYRLMFILGDNFQKIACEKSDKELARFLSIRSPVVPTSIQKEFNVEEHNRKKKRVERTSVSEGASAMENGAGASAEDKDNTVYVGGGYFSENIEDLGQIEKFVAILNYSRCKDYTSWIEVGICIYSISYKLFDLWVYFSRQNFDPIINRISDKLESEKHVCDTSEKKISEYKNDLLEWEDIIASKKNLPETQKYITDTYVVDEERYIQDLLKKWNSFSKKPNGLNKGSLIFWAKNDDEKMLRKIKFNTMREDIQDIIHNPSHTRIAKIVYKKYKYQYVCSDYEKEKGVWYEWKDHCWCRMDGVSTIRRKITGSYNDTDCIRTDFIKIRDMVIEERIQKNPQFAELKMELESTLLELNPKQTHLVDFKKRYGTNATIPDVQTTVKSLDTKYREKKKEAEKMEKELIKTYIRPYNDTMQRFMETTSFIENIVRECKQEFYDKDFNRKSNENPNLFLFSNGVFDLNKMVFREGRPEDYITLESDEMQIEYKEYDLQNEPIIKEIQEYFKKVLIDESKREFFLTLIASCLEGGNRNNLFPILTGSGANSKSLTMKFIEGCYGKYAGKLNSAFLTQKRNKSSSASPEYYSIADCRIVSSEESDANDELNTAIIKEITGNSKISSRTLYQSKMTIKTPQFTPFLICNDLPIVKSHDGGTWRRIVVISFDSKFVDDPSKFSDLKNVFLIDRNIEAKMNNWKSAFMYMLIHKYYKGYKDNNSNIIAPDCVRAFTDKFKDENDTLQPFIEANISLTGQQTDSIKLKQLYNRVQMWYREHHVGEKEPTQSAIKKYFETKYGAYDAKGWIGKKLVDL